MHLWPLYLVFSPVLHFPIKIRHWSSSSFSKFCVFISELKRRLKAEKKAAEKESKTKEQPEQEACKDEETLDPNVRLIFLLSAIVDSVDLEILPC